MAIRRLSRNLCGSLKNPRSMDLSPIIARIFLRNPQISRKILELRVQIMRKFAESALDSANPQNLIKNNLARSVNLLKSFCYFLLSQKVESPILLNLNPPSEADSQNLA